LSPALGHLPQRRVSIVLAVSTAVVLASFYASHAPRPPTWEALLIGLAFQAMLFFVVPACVVRFVLRERLGAFGVTWRMPAARCIWLVGVAILFLAVVLATRIPEVHAAYPVVREARTDPWRLLPSTLAFATYGFAWEFFFRGFLLFGLRERWGRVAILLQAVPCTLLHFGKPSLEIAASFPAALVFGVIAFANQSIVPGWVLHVAVALVMNLACVFWP
jgi:CAAX protease family protein